MPDAEMDLKELAEQALDYFESRERAPRKPGDDPTRFYTLKSYRPVWLYELAHAVHEGMFPDDFKYQTIVDVLEALSEGQDPDDLSLEPDVYNSDLIEWLASHGERAGFVDEAVENFGHSKQGIMGDIVQGQWYEKSQIKGIVVDRLNEELEQIERGEPAQMEDTSDPNRKTGPKEWSPKWNKKRGRKQS